MSSATLSQPSHTEEQATGQILVQGMTCSHCAATVKKALETIEGIRVTNIAVGTGNVSFTSKHKLPSREVLGKVIDQAGYALVTSNDELNKSEENHAKKALWLFWWSLAWSLPVVFAHWFGYMHEPWGIWVVFICATVLQPTSAITYYIGAFKALRRREANMDVLISVGVIGGYTYAVLATFLPERFPGGGMEFFEAATLLIAFVRLGKWVESRARRNASRALSMLMELAPKQVTRQKPDGSRENVSINDIAIGDQLVLLPGESLAVDAEVFEGSGHFDEAVISGESLPVFRSAGDPLVAGSTLTDSKLTVIARSTGATSTIAKITAMVRDAQNTKAPIQRMADRISSIFVPVVVGIAVVSGIYWGLFTDVGTAQVLHHVIGVLVIACPCALGLAVPAAIMLGSSECLKQGVLVKNGAALEALSKVDVIAFDKTGTLTSGKPFVTQALWSDQTRDAEEALLALSSASNHPISRAIAQWSAGQNLASLNAKHETFEVRGKGMVLNNGAESWALGNAALMRELGVDVAGKSSDSGSISYLSHNTQLVATFVIEDTERPESISVVRFLHEAGIRTVMISGDRKANAEAVAKRLGIDEVYAEVLPEGKLDILKKLQSEGHRVAMVGDGINDAPSLACADIGISMGNASDVSKESGDIVLMHGGLKTLPVAMNLARMTRTGIHRNLFLSLIYNSIGIPLAAGVAALFVPSLVLPASYASLAMVMSDLSVAAGCFWLAKKLRDIRPLHAS